MKNKLLLAVLATLANAWPAAAQTNLSTGYAADVGVVIDAQGRALAQARQAMEQAAGPGQAALAAAIQAMEQAQSALESAKAAPEKLPAALAAEQAAYQALLKAVPREFRMNRSRNRGQSGGQAGQPGQQELNQLELATDNQRYESESQAAAETTPQQRERAETQDRLKQLARRQQDLNERLRDLQTALTEARTDSEREQIQRQLKRLREEERQMLADVDQLRQRTEQSPDATAASNTRQQLERTRDDVQRASEALERQSVSEALAAGARAEQNLQTLRDQLRRQTASQFTEQMRQLRSQARDLAEREHRIARDLDALNNADQKSLDDSSQRQSLAQDLTRQQNALTNLLGQARAVTEQAETTEPLLAKQLYDIVRRADQAHTDSQLDVGAQLVGRGFLPQASQAERTARQNIDELRQSVDRAAESVLGSEAQALRFAQKELDELAAQAASELAAGTRTNSSAAAESASSQVPTNAKSNAQARSSGRNGNRRLDQPGEAQTPGERASNGETTGRQGDSAQASEQREAANGSRSNPGNGTGNNTPETPSPGQPSENPGAAQNGQASQDQASQDQASQGRASQGQAGANEGGGADGRDQLRQIARDLAGGGRGGLGLNGPITGNNYLDWTDRVRDVEQAVDSADVRNQLATVRERVGAYRRAFRQSGAVPSQEELQAKVLEPLTLARDWVGQELARARNERSLVPLDRDPVPEKYSDFVRHYYETLGGQP